MNFYLHIPYFLRNLSELGAENLHILSLCKYEKIKNRSCGSHTALQEVKEKIANIF
jgi:hypothetical protein